MMMIPILVTLVGIVIDVSDVHPWNLFAPNDKLGLVSIIDNDDSNHSGDDSGDCNTDDDDCDMLPILVVVVGIITDDKIVIVYRFIPLTVYEVSKLIIINIVAKNDELK